MAVGTGEQTVASVFDNAAATRHGVAACGPASGFGRTCNDAQQSATILGNSLCEGVIMHIFDILITPNVTAILCE
jgi:hypothetical protein